MSKPPEGGFLQHLVRMVHAKRRFNPPLRRVRRYDSRPTPAKPSIIIAQVDGSGTAATSSVSVARIGVLLSQDAVDIFRNRPLRVGRIENQLQLQRRLPASGELDCSSTNVGEVGGVEPEPPWRVAK